MTALALMVEGVQHSLPTPKRFTSAYEFGFDVLKRGSAVIGERIYVQSGVVRVLLTTTFKSKLVRCDLIRTGRQTFIPS